MTQSLVNIDIPLQEFALSPQEANGILEAFIPIFNEVEKASGPYYDLLDQEITPAVSLEAKNMGKLMASFRKAVNSTHKTRKEYYLNGGRFCDKIKNRFLEGIEEAEKQLEDIEKYEENKEKARQALLHKERLESVSAYGYDGNGRNLGALSDQEWSIISKGIKADYDEKQKAIEEEKNRQEAMRLEAIEKQKALEAENAILRQKAKEEQEARAKEIAIEKERREQEAIAHAKELEEKLQSQKVSFETQIIEKKLSEKEIIKKLVGKLESKIGSELILNSDWIELKNRIL